MLGLQLNHVSKRGPRSQYNLYCNTLLAILSKIQYLWYIFLIFYLYVGIINWSRLKRHGSWLDWLLLVVTSVICLFFLEIRRYQTLILLKGVIYNVFIFRSLLHCCFHTLTCILQGSTLSRARMPEASRSCPRALKTFVVTCPTGQVIF